MSSSHPTDQAGGLTLNEAQTRHELIDPALLVRGWQPGADIKVEETAAPVDIIHGKGTRRPKGRTDYVLRRPLAPNSEPIPLAILEAKREKQHAEHGLQQGKGYRVGQLHNVPFVFSTNGHQFVEYDEETGATSEPRPMAEFPAPGELVQRYFKSRGLPAPEAKEMQLLNTPYKQGRDYFRYYQDAAARAALEKVIRELVAKELPRVLLALGTGAGKTRIAAALLRRIFDAGYLGRGLFLCDRRELRDNGLGDFQAAFGNDAAEVDTKNPQKNARVLIATYQTLDQDTKPEDDCSYLDNSPQNVLKPQAVKYRLSHEEADKDDEVRDANFFLKHYPPGYFDVIVIDECHRSAWGSWHFILEQNKQAIQIGLTATPRQILLPVAKNEETRRKIEEDRRLLADNLRYFGEPAYEYTYQQGVADGYLAPADLETYDLYHDQQEQPERVRGVLRDDVKDKNLTNALTGQRVTPDAVSTRTEGASIESRLMIPERVQTMCAHFFERLLKTGDDDPLQKTIIFCASDHHADLVANELNALYSKWCRDHKARRVQTYAFKCMSSVNGQEEIPDFRTRQRSHIIATTKDLLTTGVNVPCVRNIVFFRYVHSPILFHQMIGRGTRIDEGTGKLMFRIFDYTGATALFGADFVSPPPPEPRPEPPPGPPPPPPIKVKGVEIEVVDTGHFNLMTKDGRLARVTPQEYQEQLIRELVAAVPTLAEFRARWLDPAQRQELLEQLAAQNLLPEILRDAAKMDAYDEFDVLAALAYRVPPLTREQRAARFGDTGPDWLVQLPPLPAKVIRAIVRQFERAGTGALEAKELWQTPEIRELKGLDTLKQAGPASELLRKTKETLFAA